MTRSPPLSIQTIRPQFYLSGLSFANRLLSTPATLDGHRQSSCQPHALAFVSLHSPLLSLSLSQHSYLRSLLLPLLLFQRKYTVWFKDILMEKVTGPGFKLDSLEKCTTNYIFAKLQKQNSLEFPTEMNTSVSKTSTTYNKL